MIYYLIIGILFILLIISIFYYTKSKKEIKGIIENKDKELNKQWEEKNQILRKKYEDLNLQLSEQLNRTNQAINQHYDELREEKENQLRSDVEKEKSILNLRMQRELDETKAQKLKDMQDLLQAALEFNNQRIEELNERTKWYEDQSAEAAQEYSEILDVLEDFRKRREVVNTQVLREKEIQEETDFFRICLSERDIEDLKIIKEIEHKFNNKEVLHKAAFDCYVRRPLSEMEKRVLGNKKPSGIYIITYIPTGEIYIGKSVDINNRWQEHVKNAFSLGSIAHSSLHTKMEEKGVWNFTFQVLEEVPKEKLGEREKYWISLYGAQSLLNQKAGG